jgi:hypothetical protein
MCINHSLGHFWSKLEDLKSHGEVKLDHHVKLCKLSVDDTIRLNKKLASFLRISKLIIGDHKDIVDNFHRDVITVNDHIKYLIRKFTSSKTSKKNLHRLEKRKNNRLLKHPRNQTKLLITNKKVRSAVLEEKEKSSFKFLQCQSFVLVEML